jgi:hypothetical protein
MKIRKGLLAIICIVLCLSLGLNIYTYAHMFKNENNATYDYYMNLIDSIKSDFKYLEYNEILGDKNFFLALPLKSKELDLISRQKVFLYKNSIKGCVIFLAISYSKYNAPENDEWMSSYCYLPEIYNSEEGEYKSSYNKKYPNIQVATHSFNMNGCHFSLLSFSNDSQGEDIAAHEMINFTNSLIDFVERKVLYE